MEYKKCVSRILLIPLDLLDAQVTEILDRVGAMPAAELRALQPQERKDLLDVMVGYVPTPRKKGFGNLIKGCFCARGT